MHISRISVTNFRNFSEVDISGLGQTTVIVGENATGKSNLLSALRLPLDPSLPETARQLVAEDFWDGLPEPFAGHQIRVEVELTNFDSDERAKALLRDCLVQTQPPVARITYVFRPKALADGSGASEGDYESLVFGGLDETRRLRGDIWRYLALRVLPALRDAEGDLQNARSPLRRLLARTSVPAATLDAAAHAIDQANRTILADKTVTQIDKALRTRLREMVGPHFSVETTLGFGVTEAPELVRAIRLFVDETKRRSLDQVSLGTANLIYLALLLEHVSEQEQEKDTVSTIIAVEEPEAHLHPQVQRVLFRDLLRGQRPLLVTTHSPHVASVAPLESLVLLRSSKGQSRAFTTTQIGLTELQRDDLERYLDVTRAEILFAKGVILVEGIAEEYIVPAFAAAAEWTLDELGITVCSIGGTDFVPYQRLLHSNGFAIPTVTLTDGDPDEDGVPQGLARRRTVGTHRAEIKAAVEAVDYATARDLFKADDVFVGDSTLEIDLAGTHPEAMCQAFDDLVPGPIRRKRFAAAVAKCAENDETARARVLREVERIGKGRYAQRLAPYLTQSAGAPPPYIADALTRIRTMVEAQISAS